MQQLLTFLGWVAWTGAYLGWGLLASVIGVMVYMPMFRVLSRLNQRSRSRQLRHKQPHTFNTILSL